MTLRGKLLLGAFALAITTPGAAMAWTKAYVVEWFEPAFQFGGPAGGNADAPGTDCPQGANDIDVKKELMSAGRAPERVADLVNPESDLGNLQKAFGFRGNGAENIYENPTAVRDPGFKEIASKVAEGLDLDGNPATGFTGVDGTPGVDNAYYKAAGCVRRWRGEARTSSTGKYHNEAMRNGDHTIMLVVSGKGADPMNDDDVTVGIYNSKTPLVMDAGGNVAADYTYPVEPNPAFQTVFAARIRNGVLEEKAAFHLKAHDHRQFPPDRPYMELEKTRVKFETQADGRMVGIIAGYRDWFDLYRNTIGNGSSVTGAIAERLGRFNAIGYYYALRRNADGLKDPATGQNRGISVAYKYYLTPAFVVTPNADEAVQVARIFDGAK